jgi:hypothetical protein
MVGAAIPAVNSSDGCHGCSSHVGSGQTNRKTSAICLYFFFFWQQSFVQSAVYLSIPQWHTANDFVSSSPET